MASKINTDNPNHHKYTCVNKQERKKKIVNTIDYNNIKVNNLKSFLFILQASIIENFNSIFGIAIIKDNNYRKPNYHSSYGSYEGIHSSYHGPNAPKGTVVVYDDCNHKSFRVIKDGKYIKNISKTKYYGSLHIEEKHFKR